MATDIPKTHPITTTTTVVPPGHDNSRKWLVAFLLLTIIFFATGGGLLGAWYNSPVSCDDFGDCSLGNPGLWNGAIACLAIGAICKLAFWITAIVRCTRRNQTTIIYTNAPGAVEAGTSLAPYPTADKAPGMRICGHCGRATNTPFCGNCGSQALSRA